MLTPLCSVISVGELATRVGAEVRPEVVETEEQTGKTCERAVARASKGLPEQEQENCRSEFREVPRTW